jgi:hypothetical protein
LRVRLANGWVLSGDPNSASRISVILSCQIDPLTEQKARVAREMG